MKFTILTLFPEIVSAFFNASIMAKAVDRGIISYELINIRDFAFDRHKTCDDITYGGGAGMLMLLWILLEQRISMLFFLPLLGVCLARMMLCVLQRKMR